MSWSFNEAQALAVKAARGAGLPWGLAEEAGQALRWLEARGLPGAAALVSALTAALPEDEETVRAWFRGRDLGAALCPLRLGAALMDFGGDAPDTAALVRQPLLLAPFLGRAGRAAAVEWPGGRVSVATGAARASGAPLAEVAQCRIAPTKPPRPARLRGRVGAEAGPALASLAELAARTYAPATEESRQLGAGAGTSDND